MPVEPNEQQLREVTELARSSTDPVVMLNLNRYRDRDEYHRGYAPVALRVLERVGGRILWQAPAKQTVIGEDANVFDEVIAVWYPSPQAFLALATDAELLEVRPCRVEALERAALICCASGAEPVLTGAA
jgi:uncharacterized protein (DUF1330 family)